MKKYILNEWKQTSSTFFSRFAWILWWHLRIQLLKRGKGYITTEHMTGHRHDFSHWPPTLTACRPPRPDSRAERQDNFFQGADHLNRLRFSGCILYPPAAPSPPTWISVSARRTRSAGLNFSHCPPHPVRRFEFQSLPAAPGPPVWISVTAGTDLNF